MTTRHELPTHLAVEDRVVAGLSMRQLLLLVSGACGAYALWLQLAALPISLRACLVVLNLAASLVFALWRPGGRSFEHWALVVLRYACVPRVAIWRPVGPAHTTPGPALRWTDFAPPVVWAEQPSTATEATP